MNHATTTQFRRWLVIGAVLGLATPALLAQDAPEPETPADPYQPEAMEVIKRSIEAIGGEEALRKHKHRTMKGEIRIASGMVMQGPMTVYSSAPNLFLMVGELEGVGPIRMGFDGNVAWSVDAFQGPMIFDGAQFEELRRQADFYGSVNHREHYREIEYVGKRLFNDAECHEIRLVDRLGNETFAYFHPESHLQIGTRGHNETPMGRIPVTTVFSEHKVFEDVKYPMLTKVSVMQLQLEQQIRIESISHETIEESKYELPAAIRALVPPSEAADDDEKRD